MSVTVCHYPCLLSSYCPENNNHNSNYVIFPKWMQKKPKIQKGNLHVSPGSQQSSPWSVFGDGIINLPQNEEKKKKLIQNRMKTDSSHRGGGMGIAPRRRSVPKNGRRKTINLEGEMWRQIKVRTAVPNFGRRRQHSRGIFLTVVKYAALREFHCIKKIQTQHGGEDFREWKRICHKNGNIPGFLFCIFMNIQNSIFEPFFCVAPSKMKGDRISNFNPHPSSYCSPQAIRARRVFQKSINFPHQTSGKCTFLLQFLHVVISLASRISTKVRLRPTRQKTFFVCLLESLPRQYTKYVYLLLLWHYSFGGKILWIQHLRLSNKKSNEITFYCGTPSKRAKPHL